MKDPFAVWHGRVVHMLVRWFWKNCRFCESDALWVEATAGEAEAEIFPRLSEKDIAESREFSKQSGHIAASLKTPDLTFCFLVSKDLSFIRPFHVHYPFHQLWNAYSPFRTRPDVRIDTLDECCDIVLPDFVLETD